MALRSNGSCYGRENITVSHLPARPLPTPTAQVEPYVKVLGVDLTIELLLKFGGAELYVAKSPGNRSRLAERDHLLQRRIPIANNWIASSLYAKGWAVSEIARRIRRTDATVRELLSRERTRNNWS